MIILKSANHKILFEGKPKMQHIRALAAAIGLLLVSACSQKPPECGDPEVQKLLKSIVTEKVAKKIDDLRVAPEQVLIESIETTKIDEKLKKNFCSANFTWKISQKSLQTAINLNGADPVNPDPEKVRALIPLFAGMVTLNPELQKTLTPKRILESFDGNDDTDVRIQFGASIMQIRATILQMQRKFPYGISNDVVNLSNKKTEYIVRLGEGEASKGKYIVEVSIPDVSATLVSELESLGHYQGIGEKYLNQSK